MRSIFKSLTVILIAAGCGGGDDDPVLSLSVGGVADGDFVRQSVSLSASLAADSDVPDRVELLDGDTVLASFTSPPYDFGWDTTTAIDGERTLSARAYLGEQSASDSVTVTVDNTAPTAMARTPEHDAVNVDLGGGIALEMSEPVLAGAGAVASVLDGLGETVEATLTASGNTVTIDLASRPALPSALSITVTGVTDRAGNEFADGAWSFTAPDFVQLGSSTSGVTEDNIYVSDVAVDSLGRIVVAYYREDQVADNVHVARFEAGAWVELGGALSAVPGNTSTSFGYLAIDADDNPVVAWNEQALDQRDVYVYRYDGSSWAPVGAPLSAQSAAGTNAFNMRLAVEPAGNLVATWAEQPAGSGPADIYVAREDAGTWTIIGSALEEYPGNFEPADRPSLAIDSAGVIHVAWHERNAGREDVIVYRHDGGTNWTQLGAAINPDPGTVFAINPSLAFDNNDTAYVAFNDSGVGSNGLASYRYDGQAWVEIATGASATGGFPYEPHLRRSANGDMIAMWRENQTSGAELLHAARLVNGSWQLVTDGVEALQGPATYMEGMIATVAGDQIVLAWSEVDTEGYANSYVARENALPSD